MRNIQEVRYIDTSFEKGGGKVYKKNWQDVENQEPIKNNEMIRVFHGCDLKTAVTFAKQGLSGKQRQPRKYSYENGMNPIGLFVSTSFETVKEFSNPFHGGKNKNASVIIEFTANSNDLDTPVWNNSETYFGQGTNPQSFRNRNEREMQKAKYQDNARENEFDYVKNSDNPAMARNIFLNREHQALYTGDLSPNMIKRFWVKQYDGNRAIEQEYTPMKRVEFLKRYGEEEFGVDGYYNKYEKIDKGYKLFNANENFTSFKDMAIRQGKRVLSTAYGKGMLQRKYNGDTKAFFNEYIPKHEKEFASCIKNKWYDELALFLWPKQLQQLLGRDEYMNHFDRFGIGVKDENFERLVQECMDRLLEKIKKS